jgi:hypothetical protein
MYYNDDLDDLPIDGPERADASAAAGDDADTLGHIAEAPAPSALNADSAAPPAKPDLTGSFLAEISRAMRAAAVQERSRISGAVAESTVAHEQKVRERGATEANELRRLADEDVEGIQQSADEAIQAIRAEAEKKVVARRRALVEYLDRHAALVETEIGRVNGAVDDYNAQLDGFFGRLAEEENPAEIARLAGQLPEPPNLDEVGAMARAEAVAQIADEPGESERGGGEGDVVGVMAAGAGEPVFDASADAAEPDAAPDAEPAPVAAEPEPVPAGGIADDEPAAETPPSNGISAASLLRNLTPWANSDRSSSSENGPH